MRVAPPDWAAISCIAPRWSVLLRLWPNATASVSAPIIR